MNQETHLHAAPTFGPSSSLPATSVAPAPSRTATHPLLLWVAAAGLCLSVTNQVVAQEYALLTSKAPVPAKPVAAKGFWKMTTEPGADSTLVGFYTPGNTLLHEEKLPNRAVKLTKRNLRTLNEMTESLMSAHPSVTGPNALANALDGKNSPQAGQLQIGAYASRDGIHLHLMLDNPAHDHVSVELLDENKQTVYQTVTRSDKYHFKFNMAEMPVGNYQLRVLGRKQHFERELTYGYPTPEPILPTLRMAIK